MARRGLVSKGMGGPQSGGGNSALMPKGEKPKGPQLMPVAEVAKKLRVDQSHVEGWMQKGQLRGNSSGIRPYDFKKFQLDFAEEIKRAQKEAVQLKNQSAKSDRSPKKGFFSRMAAFFGGGDDGGASKTLVKENEKLKSEIAKLQKLKKSTDKSGTTRDLEEKLRFLEKQVAEGRKLEAEVAQLRRQVKEQPSAAPAADENLVQELEEARRKASEAEKIREEAEQTRDALSRVESEKEQLQLALAELKNQAPEATPPGDPIELQQLQETIQQREEALAQAQQQASALLAENEKLKAAASVEQEAPTEEAAETNRSDSDTELVDELLELQRRNLERFKKLQALYLESVKKETSEPSDLEQDESYRELKAKYDELVAQQGNEGPEHQEVLQQLSEARFIVSRLEEENEKLQSQLKEASEDGDQRAQELQARIESLSEEQSSHKAAERELTSLRKGLETKESQMQKITAKLAENEKRLAKALEESGRLTELLIERENRLRELSDEFEQEYREKIGNLDRQVSGLQWKLSLREERIAQLESELLRNTDQ